MIRSSFFVTAAAGTADLLASELAALGIESVREVLGGVACESELAGAYRACLESRLGLRVLWQIARFPVADANALYAGIREIDWSTHMDADGTLAVDFSGSVPGVTHTQFGAQRVKDAVVDQFRERTGTRPSVDRDAPWLRINVHASRGAVTVAIDLSGDSLHRRGYRGGQGAAPLKENLAAAILIRAGWPAIAAAGGGFVDPMCGSGTFPIEAALIAADIAPGLFRERFGFERWKQHDAAAWSRLRADAESRRQPDLLTPGRIRGFDRDPGRNPRRRSQCRARRPRKSNHVPALRAREASRRAIDERAGRRESAVRRAHRRIGRASRALRAPGRAPAFRLSRLGSRGASRGIPRSAASSASMRAAGTR